LLRTKLRGAPTPESLLAAAAHLRRSGEPVAAITGTLIETAVEQRLAAEVVAHRLPPNALESLMDSRG